MAPPTKLTDDLAVKLIDALRRLPIRLACERVGLAEQSYHNWIGRGEAGEEPFASWRALALTARAEYVDDRLQVIHDAARTGVAGDWKAAAWYLERCWPEFFALQTKSKTELSGPHGEPLRVRLDRVSDDELAQLEQILERACRPGDDPAGSPAGGGPGGA